MANTTNFGWETPDDTDLVKDGALAMRTLGNAIDTSLVDLKGGTTGQVLSKNTNTDMDFTWVTPNDADAIQNSIVDAKGDLIAASANDTPARLAVGNNGETLVADSSATTGLRWQGQYPAGKNVLINGLLDIWQRNTSATFTAEAYNAQDRWANYASTSSTFARESSVVPTGCVYSCKVTVGASSASLQSSQVIETLNAAPLAGQTVTFSGYFQSSATPTISFVVYHSSSVDVALGGSWTTITASSGGSGTAGASSFTRISGTYVIPSTAKSVKVLWFSSSIASAGVLYWGGMQLEIGSVATAPVRNAATLAGELAACQRYYWRTSNTGYGYYGIGYAELATQLNVDFKYPVTMRTSPSVSSSAAGNLAAYRQGAFIASTSAMIVNQVSTDRMLAYCTTAAGSLTQFSPYVLFSNNVSSFVEFSAEL